MLRKLTIALFAAFLACAPAQAQTGSSKTPTVLNTEVNALWPDQNAGGITPFNARQTLLDIIASYGNLNQPVGGALTGTLPNPLLGSGVVGTSNLAANAVNDAALAQTAARTIKCNPTSGLATPTNCTLGAGLSFSGSSLISMPTSGNVFNILNSPYNANCNYNAVSDGAMGSGSTTLTSATAIFAVGDVGKYIAVGGAGSAGANLFTTIATFVNSTTVTLTSANASGGAVSGKSVEYGNDDTTAIQSAITATVAAGGGTVYIPGGSRCLISKLNLTNLSISLTIQGDGVNASEIFPLQVASYGTATGHLFDLTGSSFVRLNNFQIGAFYELAVPTTAIFMAQVASGVSNRNGISHMYISGQFTAATFYDYGVPSLFTIQDSDFYNYLPGAGTHNTLYLTATNLLSLSSSFATVTTGAQSTSDILFAQSEFHKFAGSGADNAIVLLDAATSITFASGVISGGATAYVWLNGAVGPAPFVGVTMETESQPVIPTNGYFVNAGATFPLPGISDDGTKYITSGSTFSTAPTSTTTVHYSH